MTVYRYRQKVAATGLARLAVVEENQLKIAEHGGLDVVIMQASKHAVGRAVLRGPKAMLRGPIALLLRKLTTFVVLK